MRRLLPCAALFALAFALPAADEWPAHRGPHGNGTSDAKALPTEWNEKTNIKWKVPLPGKAWSSPVVWGHQVWVTNATPDGKQLSAVCVDRDKGTIVYDTKVFQIEKPQFAHAFNSHASCTPAIEDGRVYVHFGSSGTACLDTKTGEKVWEQTDLKCDHWRGPGSSPIIYQDKLILIFDGHDKQYVTALHKSNGKPAWTTSRDIRYTSDDGDIKKAYATPAVVEVAGKPQLVCPSAECTVAYNPDDGKELWRVTHGGMNVSSRPVFGHGLMYLTSGHNGKLLAVKQGVSGVVPKDAVQWQTNKAVPTRPSLLLLGDLIFMVDDKGIASCLDAKTGKVHWSERLGGEYSASPVSGGGHVYFCDQLGKTTVVKAAKEFESVAENKLDGGFMASPAVAGENLFLRTKTHLYCVGK